MGEKKAERERDRDEENKRKEGVENKSTTDRVTNCSTEIETKLLKRPFDTTLSTSQGCTETLDERSSA